MSIEVPEEFKDDPAQARAHAKRKGTLTRVVVVDGREVKKETEFTA